MKPEYIFPTRYKPKISRTLSYPIGAERISEALQDVPQATQLTISFSYYNCAPHAKDRAKSYPVFEAVYNHRRPGFSSSRAMIEKGWYEPKWELTVKAVPRELKHTITQLLLSEGLPLVRSWLLTNKTFAGTHSYHRLTLVFDESTGLLRPEHFSSL